MSKVSKGSCQQATFHLSEISHSSPTTTESSDIERLSSETLMLDDPPVADKEQVNAFVELILHDESLNIKSLPDWLEKKIYKVVIHAVLNHCIKGFYTLDGINFIGHHLRVELASFTGTVPSMSDSRINRGAIERLVSELLKHSELNIQWLPDRIERQIYINVITVAFIMLEIFFSTTKLQILGHTFQAKFAASGKAYLRFIDHLKRKKFKPTNENVSSLKIDKEVEILLRKDDFKSHNFLTYSLERRLFKMVFQLVLMVVHEITANMNIELAGNKLGVQVWPGKAPPKRSKLETEKINERNEEQRNIDGIANTIDSGEKATDHDLLLHSNSGLSDNTSVHEKILNDPPEASALQVEAYVKFILENEDLNIKGLPDWIEKHIYRVTIGKALNLCFQSLYVLNGLEFLGHHLKLEHIVSFDSTLPSFQVHELGKDKESIRSLVQEFLKDSEINISWLQDHIEEEVYVNIISVVFTVLQMFLALTKLEFVGHVFEGVFAPNEKSPEKVTNSFKHKHPPDKAISAELIAEQVQIFMAKEDFKSHNQMTRGLEQNLYTMVFHLVLTVVNEATSDMCMNVMGTQISLQLYPGKAPPKRSEERRKEDEDEYELEINRFCCFGPCIF